MTPTVEIMPDGRVRVSVYVDRLRTMYEMRDWLDGIDGIRYTHPPLGQSVSDWATRVFTPWLIDFPDEHSYTLFLLKFDQGAE